VRVFTDERGIPSVEIQPIPQGRKKNKVFGLFKIWHADLTKRVAARWLASDPDHQALQFLTDLGIKANMLMGHLVVDRTSMVNFSPRLGEQAAYDAVLRGVQAEFPRYRVYWSGRTDDWMGLDLHPVRA